MLCKLPNRCPGLVTFTPKAAVADSWKSPDVPPVAVPFSCMSWQYKSVYIRFSQRQWQLKKKNQIKKIISHLKVSEEKYFFSAQSIKLKAWCQSLKTGTKWELCPCFSPYGTLNLPVCPSSSVLMDFFFCIIPVLIQALLRRCRPPPQPWTFSNSSSRTIASRTWSPRPTCTPRSSRSALAQTKVGVPSLPRRWRPFSASWPPPACTAVSRCSASGAQASSATAASPWRWARRALRRSSSTSTSWLSGRLKEATRACTRSSPSWTHCNSHSAAHSDLHRHRCVQYSSPGFP